MGTVPVTTKPRAFPEPVYWLLAFGFGCASLHARPVGAQGVVESPVATEPAATPSSVAIGQPSSSEPSARLTIDSQGAATALADQARGYQDGPSVEDEDVVLAVPRGVLLLPQLALGVVFWPIDQVVRVADDNHLLQHLERILYFDEAHQFGWSPSIAFASGFGPTLGAKLFHTSLFGHDELVELRASYLGRYVQSYQFEFAADRLNGSRTWLELRARYEAESGALFGGLGIAAVDATGVGLDARSSNRRTYFAQDRALGLVRAGYTAGEPGALVKIGASAVFNWRRFARNTSDKLQSEDVYDRATIPGYGAQVQTLELQLNLVTDLRSGRGLMAQGFYLEAFAGRVPTLFDYGYYHYGAEVSYTVDLYKGTRLLTFRTALEAVEGAEREIPFSDLPRLGGPDRLRGYQEGRFRDRRAALVSAEYRYPIHKNVEGELFVDAGYVSRKYRDLYDLRDWKVGYGGGLVFGSADSVSFRCELAYGDALQVMVTGGIPGAFNGRSTQL